MDPYGFSGFSPGFAPDAAPDFLPGRLDQVAQQFARTLQELEQHRQLEEAINSPAVQSALVALLTPPTSYKPGQVPPTTPTGVAEAWGAMAPAAGMKAGGAPASGVHDPLKGGTPENPAPSVELINAFARAAGTFEPGRWMMGEKLTTGAPRGARPDAVPAQSAFAQAGKRMTPEQFEMLAKLAPQLVQRFSPIEVTERTKMIEEGKNRRADVESGIKLGRIQNEREMLERKIAAAEAMLKSKLSASSKQGAKDRLEMLRKRAALYQQKLANTMRLAQDPLADSVAREWAVKQREVDMLNFSQAQQDYEHEVQRSGAAQPRGAKGSPDLSGMSTEDITAELQALLAEE